MISLKAMLDQVPESDFVKCYVKDLVPKSDFVSFESCFEGVSAFKSFYRF